MSEQTDRPRRWTMSDVPPDDGEEGDIWEPTFSPGSGVVAVWTVDERLAIEAAMAGLGGGE